MRTKSKKTHKNTQISISVPTELIAKIDKMAAAQNRNRSNFIVNAITNMARDFFKGDKQ